MDNVGHGAQGEWEIEDVPEELDNATVGTMADENQAKNGLAEEGFGDGEGEQDLLILGGWGAEGQFEGLLRLVGLLGDELEADVVLVGKVADGLGAGQGSQGQLLTLIRGQILGGTGSGWGGWWQGRRLIEWTGLDSGRPRK